MRIAVIGAGGVGGPLGASPATSGQDVIFIARGAHLAAMRAKGLLIEGDRGTTHVENVQATDDPSTLGSGDLVLSCVKLWDLEASAIQIKPMIGRDTVVIPLQNGVDASECLSPILGARHILGGVAMVVGSIVNPGVVRQTGKHHGIIFGELNGQASPRVDQIRDICKASGIESVVPDNIQVARWNKFIGLAAMAGVCAVTRHRSAPCVRTQISRLWPRPRCERSSMSASRATFDLGRKLWTTGLPSLVGSLRMRPRPWRWT